MSGGKTRIADFDLIQTQVISEQVGLRKCSCERPRSLTKNKAFLVFIAERERSVHSA